MCEILANRALTEINQFVLNNKQCELAALAARIAAAHATHPCSIDFFVGIVLAERVDRINCCRQPTDDGYLQEQADDPGNRASDGEKQYKRQ